MTDRSLKTKEEILKFIENPEKEAIASKFFDFAKKEELKEHFNITAKYYSFTFYPPTSPRALFKLDIGKNNVRIKAQLFFIEGHTKDLDILSQNLKDMIKNTPPCTMCSMNCKQGTKFHMDGEEYFSCINEGHFFKEITIEEEEELEELLRKELYFIKDMKDRE